MIGKRGALSSGGPLFYLLLLGVLMSRHFSSALVWAVVSTELYSPCKEMARFSFLLQFWPSLCHFHFLTYRSCVEGYIMYLIYPFCACVGQTLRCISHQLHPAYFFHNHNYKSWVLHFSVIVWCFFHSMNFVNDVPPPFFLQPVFSRLCSIHFSFTIPVTPLFSAASSVFVTFLWTKRSLWKIIGTYLDRLLNILNKRFMVVLIFYKICHRAGLTLVTSISYLCTGLSALSPTSWGLHTRILITWQSVHSHSTSSWAG